MQDLWHHRDEYICIYRLQSKTSTNSVTPLHRSPRPLAFSRLTADICLHRMWALRQKQIETIIITDGVYIQYILPSDARCIIYHIYVHF